MDAVDRQMLEAIARRVRAGTLDEFLAQGQGCWPDPVDRSTRYLSCSYSFGVSILRAEWGR
jgi:hypothetical protein